jgi:hypothetical protein
VLLGDDVVDFEVIRECAWASRQYSQRELARRQTSSTSSCSIRVSQRPCWVSAIRALDRSRSTK